MYTTNLWNLLSLHGHKVIKKKLLKHFSTKNAVFFLFACTCLLLGTIKAQAQATSSASKLLNMPNHDKKKVHFGIVFGFNRANFAITHSPNFLYHDSIKVVDSPKSPGFNVGIISDLHLTPRTDLRFIPTLSFAEKDLRYTEIKGLGDTSVTKTIESILLSFPLLFKYKSDRFFKGNFRFYALGGVRFDWDLASNSKARKATDIVKINPYDLAIEYGVGLEFFFPLFIFSPEIKFTNGLPNMFVPTPNLRYSNVLDQLKNRYLTISIQFEG